MTATARVHEMLPTDDVSPLRRGKCRFLSKPHRRRRPRSSELESELHTGPLLIVWRQTHDEPMILSLCGPQDGYFYYQKDEVMVCWDSAVRLVILEKSEGSPEKTLPDMLDPSTSSSLMALYGLSVATEIPGDQCRDRDHHHASVRSQTIPSSALGCEGWVAEMTDVPATLLSVSLVRYARDMHGRLTPLSLLAQSCLKRQLVGTYVAFVTSQLSTEITVSLAGNTHRLRVDSVATSVTKQANRDSMLYLIMPSTRVTVLDAEESELKNNVDTAHDVSSSLTARLLIDTLRIVRRLKTGCVPRSFLLSGPPGVGKTHAVCVAVRYTENEGPVQLIGLQGAELFSTGSVPAEAAKALAGHFQRAARFCETKDHVALVFIDECESLLSSDVVAAMLATLLDQVSSTSTINKGWQRLVVVCATNMIDAVPAWLRRPGRIDREIAIAPPHSTERRKILQSLIPESEQVDGDSLAAFADECVGYVPADLAALVRKASLLGMEHSTAQMNIHLLRRAMQDVGASALRDSALSAPPATTWDDIAGDAGGAKSALRRAIEWPRTKRQAYLSLGLVPPRGVLLHGPPGCAKTSLARAAAGSAAVAFFSLSPADVYASSYMGEAEAVVRRAFALARSASPSILFFDEIDSILGSNNSGGGHGTQLSGRGSSAEARVLSTFLNEMDGVDAQQTDGVLVFGATNRPATLDAALLRPGRFDNVIYVPPPDREARRAILQMHCRHWKNPTTFEVSDPRKNEETIDIDYLSSDEMTGAMTGAEVVGACREAAMLVLRDSLQANATNIVPRMNQRYLETAILNVNPLLSKPGLLDQYADFEHRG